MMETEQYNREKRIRIRLKVRTTKNETSIHSMKYKLSFSMVKKNKAEYSLTHTL